MLRNVKNTKLSHAKLKMATTGNFTVGVAAELGWL